MPAHWLTPVRGQPDRWNSSVKSHHVERFHYGKHTTDMRTETDLCLVPADWSQTSKMNDPRPNGRFMFDARFVATPMGRARGGRAMAWDPRGTDQLHESKVRRFQNIDFNGAAAKQHAAMVAKGAKAAQYAEYYDGVQLSEGQGVDRSYEVMIASMSKLQRRQIDKDGDGKLSGKELAAHGFGNEMDFGSVSAGAPPDLSA